MFETLIVLGICLGGFNTILLLILLKLVDQFLKFLSLGFVTLDLVLELLKFIFKSCNSADLFALFLLSCSHILVQQISFTSLLLDVLFVVLNAFFVVVIRYSNLSQLVSVGLSRPLISVQFGVSFLILRIVELDLSSLLSALFGDDLGVHLHLVSLGNLLLQDVFGVLLFDFLVLKLFDALRLLTFQLPVLLLQSFIGILLLNIVLLLTFVLLAHLSKFILFFFQDHLLFFNLISEFDRFLFVLLLLFLLF